MHKRYPECESGQANELMVFLSRLFLMLEDILTARDVLTSAFGQAAPGSGSWMAAPWWGTANDLWFNVLLTV